MSKRSTGKVSGLAVHGDSGARSDLKFKGVRRRKWGKWVSEVRLPNSRQRIWLGSYDTAEKAARAFDAAVFCLRGRAARLNFPGSPPEIRGVGSLTSEEIQAAAARFAHSGAVPAKAKRSGSVSPAPSPSLSVSEASSVLTIDESELAVDLSFLDGEPDFGAFPGVVEYSSHFYGMKFPGVGSQAPNHDQFLAQDNFLGGF